MSHSQPLSALLALLMLLPAPVVSEPKPVIGLVLEGGGALGFAHVGVLKVLEEERVPVHRIAGTSMGSIVGAAYASGRTIAEIEKLISETNWDALFNEAAPRRDVLFRQKSGRQGEIYGDAKFGVVDGDIKVPTGVVQGQRIELLFRSLFGKARPGTSFDQLPIPFRAVAADIETGQPVIIGDGDLATAARASMSVPGFFVPIERNGQLLVDGGITNNFPVDVALNMGAEVLIAVKLDVPVKPRNELTGPLAISGQILNFLLSQTSQRGLERLRPGDILVTPDIGAYSSTSFGDAIAIMKEGEAAARAIVPRLRSLSLSKDAYARYAAKRTASAEYQPPIAFVEVRGFQPHRREVLQAAIDSCVGEPLNHEHLSTLIEQEYSRGEYEKITYDLVSREEGQGVVITAQEKTWRKNFVRLGFSLEDDFESSHSYALALNSRLTNLNEWGAYADLQIEVGRAPRFFSEWYQPLGEGGRFFLAPEFALGKRPLGVRQGGEEIARYVREEIYAGLKGGISLYQYGELAVGIRRGEGRLDRDIGDPALPEFDYDIGAVTYSIDVDQLDNADFPTAGYRVALSGLSSHTGLDASDNFDQGQAFLTKPFTSGSLTLLIAGEMGASSSNLPVEQSFSLGGMFNVSGYPQGVLTADRYWAARTMLYHRFLEGESSLVTFGGYVGGSLEFASLRSDAPALGDHPDIVAGYVFVGLDTPLLPVDLAYGLNDDSESSVYLTVGRLAGRRR